MVRPTCKQWLWEAFIEQRTFACAMFALASGIALNRALLFPKVQSVSCLYWNRAASDLPGAILDFQGAALHDAVNAVCRNNLRHLHSLVC